MNDIPQLTAAVVQGDLRALARAMSLVEAGGGLGVELLASLPPLTGDQSPGVIGVTGLPGAGKSSLIDHLIEAYRTRGNKVGVVAVDPSSPVHGGAILGDRVRMMRHATSTEVIIRSLASRGSLGGLTPAVSGVIRVMAAAGCRPIFVETVGMGQLGWDIANVARVVIAVTAPGLGDEVQMMKSGLLDIVDVLVVNKADLPGAATTLVCLQDESEHRHLKLIPTSAATGQGIAPLVECLDQLLLARTVSTSPPALDGRAVLEAKIVDRSLALVRPVLASRVTKMELNDAPETLARRLVAECFPPAPAITDNARR